MKTVPESEGEDMKILSAGDVHLHQESQGKSEPSFAQKIAPLLAVAGMSAGIPLAGIAGYMLSQKPAPQPVVSEPANTTIERDYQIGEVVIE